MRHQALIVVNSVPLPAVINVTTDITMREAGSQLYVAMPKLLLAAAAAVLPAVLHSGARTYVMEHAYQGATGVAISVWAPFCFIAALLYFYLLYLTVTQAPRVLVIKQSDNWAHVVQNMTDQDRGILARYLGMLLGRGAGGAKVVPVGPGVLDTQTGPTISTFPVATQPQPGFVSQPVGDPAAGNTLFVRRATPPGGAATAPVRTLPAQYAEVPLLMSDATAAGMPMPNAPLPMARTMPTPAGRKKTPPGPPGAPFPPPAAPPVPSGDSDSGGTDSEELAVARVGPVRSAAEVASMRSPPEAVGEGQEEEPSTSVPRTPVKSTAAAGVLPPLPPSARARRMGGCEWLMGGGGAGSSQQQQQAASPCQSPARGASGNQSGYASPRTLASIAGASGSEGESEGPGYGVVEGSESDRNRRVRGGSAPTNIWGTRAGRYAHTTSAGWRSSSDGGAHINSGNVAAAAGSGAGYVSDPQRPNNRVARFSSPAATGSRPRTDDAQQQQPAKKLATAASWGGWDSGAGHTEVVDGSLGGSRSGPGPVAEAYEGDTRVSPPGDKKKSRMSRIREALRLGTMKVGAGQLPLPRCAAERRCGHIHSAASVCTSLACVPFQ
jgi:hypothetical protein